MLKISKTDFDKVIKEMRSQRNSAVSVVPSSEYYESHKQKVSVCMHTPDHIGRYHTHEFFEINYVQKGNCINLVEDDNIFMSEGDMIIMHPGAFHNLYANADCVVYNFLIDKKWLCSEVAAMLSQGGAVFEFLREAGNDDFYKYVLCPVSDGNGRAISLAERLIELSRSASAWRYLYCEATMLECLGALCENSNGAYLSHGRGQSSYIMIDMLTYVVENCATVDLDKMSERYFYSKTHICRLFLKNTGKSFNKTLMDMKIGRACSLLENSEMTAEEIAHAVGYDSVEYFYRLFKQKTGMTPKEYKNKASRLTK